MATDMYGMVWSTKNDAVNILSSQNEDYEKSVTEKEQYCGYINSLHETVKKQKKEITDCKSTDKILENAKTNIEKVFKENRDLHDKVKSLMDRAKEKNSTINKTEVSNKKLVKNVAKLQEDLTEAKNKAIKADVEIIKLQKRYDNFEEILERDSSNERHKDPSVNPK